MIRVFVFGVLQQIKSEIEAERYYIRFHSQEFLRAWGPWMTRYETYRAYEPPPEAKRFGAIGSFYTEHWWRSIEDFDEAHKDASPYTPWVPTTVPPIPPRAITAIPPLSVYGTAVKGTARPTEDLLGKRPPMPEQMPILRWLRAFKYPDGVSVEEGDKWYLQTYSQQAKEQPGLLKYVCYTCIQPSPMHRVEELWYQDFDVWRKAVIESPPRYTPPPWGRKEEPFVDMMSTFVRTKPTWDWLRDRPLVP